VSGQQHAPAAFYTREDFYKIKQHIREQIAEDNIWTKENGSNVIIRRL
jgi:hypothetical protein